jgi:hypothetical protein
VGKPCAEGPVRSTRWGIVAFNVIHDRQLSVCARMVYTSMATRAARNGHLEVCQLTMARDIGRSRAWVNAGAQELEACGLVTVERRFVGRIQRSSRYVLIDGLRSVGVRTGDSGAVGESTSVPAVEPGDHGDGPDKGEIRRQPATIRDGQPADGKPHSTDRLHCQPADTSHESQIHISLSDGCERAGRSMDQGSAAPPVDAPAIGPDWRPADDDLAWARARMPDLDTEAFTQAFVLTCLAKGYRYADPGFGWRLWIADPKKPLPTLGSKPQSNPQFNTQFKSQAPSSGDSHDRIDIEFQASENTSGGRRKIFSGGWAGQGPGDIRALNAGRAAACLGRILERRAPGASA